MTIRCKVHKDPDVFGDKSVLHFGRQREHSQLPVAGVTVSCSVDHGMPIDGVRAFALERAVAGLERACADYQLWLYSINAAWQPDSRVVRHYGFWKRPDFIGMQPSQDLEEKAIATAAGVKFATRVRIERREVEIVEAVWRLERTTMLVASPSHGLISLDTLLNAGWAADNGGVKYWRSLAVAVCELDGTLGRLFGEFDERLAGVNLLAPLARYAKIAAVL